MTSSGGDRKRISRRSASHYISEARAKEKLLLSIHKISSLLTRPISLDRVLTSIVEETSNAFGFSRIAIFLVNKDPKLLECKYLIGFLPDEKQRAFSRPFHLEKHDCIETMAARTGKTIFVKDYETDLRVTPTDLKIRRLQTRVSALAVPLKIKREIIGLLEADKNSIKMDVTRSVIKSFSIFANHASILIENARLQEQNKKKIEQLLLLQEISKKVITPGLSPTELMDLVSANAQKITKASTCLLLLVDNDGRQLTIGSQKGCSLDRRKFKLKIGQGVAGRVAKTGVPVIVRDTALDTEHPPIIRGIRSELAVPLVREKKVKGVLNLGSFDQAAFSQDDMEVLMILASQAAIFMDNVRLYNQVITERNFVENILESSPSGVITVDCKKRIRHVNRKAEQVLGIKRGEVFNKKAKDALQRLISDILDLTVTTRAIVDNIEVQFTHGSGANITLGVSTSLLRRHDNRMVGAIATFKDLTVAKKTEELIRRMDRLSSLGQLSAGIAHEIRNPLASINFNVQMLAKKLSTDEHTRRIINDTREGIDRIKSLVKGILDFARPNTPLLKPGNINRILVDSVDLMRPQLAKTHIDVETDLGEEGFNIVFDPHQVQQVFINLLLNSIDAMPDGGTLKIGTAMEMDPCARSPHLVIRISDSGLGIPAENHSKIFDPFFTTKSEGTGLGLSIVHKILEQHGAAIDMTSAPSQGATFILRFPIDKVEADANIQNTDR